MKTLLTLSLLVLPVLVLAAPISSANDLAAFIVNFINTVLVPVVFALAFIVFIWGIFKAFILGGEKPEESRKQGRQLILYGLIGFFVMVSVWGLVNILTSTIEFSNPRGPEQGLPSAPTPRTR